MAGREHFFYGAVVGAGALALGAGAFVGTLALWRTLRQRHHHHDDHQAHSHGHAHGHFGDEDTDNYHLKTFLTGQYAPVDELMMYPFVPRDALDFHRKCADLCIKHKQHILFLKGFWAVRLKLVTKQLEEGVVSRAMEVGCATGRTSFELCRGFESVLGVDISQTFLNKCNKIKATGQIDYWLPREGELGETKTVHLSSDIDRNRVQFIIGDACDLPPLEQVGCLFSSNMLCSIQYPRKYLKDTHKYVVPGGTLVMAENYLRHGATDEDKSHWLGGYKDKNGVEVRAVDTVHEILSPHFELVESFDMPVMTMEEPRMWFWVVDHVTVWRRKQDQ